MSPILEPTPLPGLGPELDEAVVLMESTEEIPELNPLSTTEELKSYIIKKFETCLLDAGIHMFGLKVDLVKHLYYY